MFIAIFPSDNSVGESSDNWTVVNMSNIVTWRVATSVEVTDQFAVSIVLDSSDCRIVSFFFMSEVALVHHMHRCASVYYEHFFRDRFLSRR